MLRREQENGIPKWVVNHKRVYRIYQEEGLAMRRKKRKRFRADHAGEKLSQERRESGEPWRRKTRPPEMNLRKRSKEERFVGYRRDVHRGAICTSSASGSG